MTSAKNSVSEPPNMKIFWGKIPPPPPNKIRAFSTCDNAPLSQKPSSGPDVGHCWLTISGFH